VPSSRFEVLRLVLGSKRKPQTVLKPLEGAYGVPPDVMPLAQGSLAFSPLVCRYPKSWPCHALEPCLGTALITPPRAPPYSASKLLDLICPSCRKSILKFFPAPPF